MARTVLAWAPTRRSLKRPGTRHGGTRVASSSPRGTILLVDDDPDIRLLLKTVLCNAGFATPARGESDRARARGASPSCGWPDAGGHREPVAHQRKDCGYTHRAHPHEA